MRSFLAVFLFLPLAGFAGVQGFIIADKTEFKIAGTSDTFTPWGFNYDRDFKSRLLEDYWDAEWATVEQDLREMKDLGANVVRIHLQFGKFMSAADGPNEASLRQLDRLVRLAEHTGLYLDLTGLGCYRKQDVPEWFDALPESERWDAQARFWEAIAQTCADRPGVFCYDLMNEPVAATDKQPDGQWLHPHALGGFHYVQYINLDPAGRSRDQIFRAWVGRLSAAIRAHDQRHLITVGLLPFAPGEVARDLDFLSVHVYPLSGKVDDALKTVKAFDFGKPIVIEEIFLLSCSIAELGDFIARSRDLGARGWIGFYWGQTPAELKTSKAIGDAMTLSWLGLFQSAAPSSRPGSTQPARR